MSSIALTTNEIGQKIYFIRGHRVMLDSDLANLYGVETRALNQAVHRNLDRFPEDFMFRLTKTEYKTLISQIVISKTEPRGGRQKLPLVFTEQGVAMLSAILKSKRAIQVNILIVRTFVKLREMLQTHKELAKQIEKLEKKYMQHDKQFHVVFDTIRKLLIPALPDKRRRVGFKW